MSKKLLNESTVRRFMGLANLAPLSESFLDSQVNEEEEINEETETVEEAAEATNEEAEAVTEGEETIEEAAEATNESAEEITEGEETVEEAAEATNEAAEATNEAAEEIAEGEETVEEAVEAVEEGYDMDEEDMDATDDIEADAGEDMADKARALLDALADALSAAGIDVNVTDTEEEPAADMDAEMDDMEDVTAAADDMIGDDEEEGEEVEMAEAQVEEGATDLDALVAEITARVMERLKQ